MEPEVLQGLAAIQGAARLDGLRILVAEDNEINQLVVQAMLAPEGPTLVFASDGEQAVQRVAEEGADAFHLVLMDLQMPVMDGYEATSRILTLAPNLPIVAQTAQVLTNSLERCQAAGMVAHLSKPVDRDQLIETILRHARQP
jgi:CheY-like chemotaxis protein